MAMHKFIVEDSGENVKQLKTTVLHVKVANLSYVCTVQI